MQVDSGRARVLVLRVDLLKLREALGLQDLQGFLQGGALSA